MNTGPAKRLLAACVLAFYMMLPHAAFGFTGPGCACVESALKCGQNGRLCHCCQQGKAFSLGGTLITKCRAVSDDFNISHPPTVLEPVASPVLKPATLEYAFQPGSIFYETFMTPPLRPPAAVPSF